MMKRQQTLTSVLALVLLLTLTVSLALAQGPGPQEGLAPQDALGTAASAPLSTSFTYQGQLQSGGEPVTDDCRMAFRLYDHATQGSQVGSAITTGVSITGGLFTVGLDFGPGLFDGDERWLGIQVECPDDAGYADLGRQRLTAAPYALHALSAGSVPWNGLTGVPDDFADGVDDVMAVVSGTNIFAGDGLTQVSSGNSVTMSVYFAGSGGDYGTAISVARSDHAHDDRYYTETELQTGGSAGVHWDNLTGVPSGLADGDDDTLASLACADGQLAEWNDGAGEWVCGEDEVGGSGDYWSLTGNAGTDPATHFLGTTDVASLTLVVEGTTALQLEPSEGVPNLIGGYGGNWVTGGASGASIGGGGADWGLNRVTDEYGTISGGADNQAGDDAGGVGDAPYAVVGGGYLNTAGGDSATIAGGNTNTAGPFASVGGGYGNFAPGDSATIAGGNTNAATGVFGDAVGGGYQNVARGGLSTVGGGYQNATNDWFATVGGGFLNFAGAVSATIGGGEYVSVTGRAATVAGGSHIIVTGDYAVVGGGQHNTITANGPYATIGGGYYNTAGGWYATIGGGHLNQANGYAATIAGGWNTTAAGDYTTVGGGVNNDAIGIEATVGGGYDNTASNRSATVSGGTDNLSSGEYATVGGGESNTVTATHAIIGGGYDNIATGNYAVIGGGRLNEAFGVESTIAGGVTNLASGTGAFVGGGQHNEATDPYATIGGGHTNHANGDYATVGGGWMNSATGDRSTVGGGYQNEAISTQSTVAGGADNHAGYRATVGGGLSNFATAAYATVPGGYNNVADGQFSFAAGRRAHAYTDGSFVWADSNDFDFSAASTANQFRVRATGGAYFVVAIDGSGNSTWTCSLSDGSAWMCSSDRNLKENLVLVDGTETLERLSQVPIFTWNAKGQSTPIRHIGPMAQDFYAAFEVGQDERHIATIDLDGVALAAIQGLYEHSQKQAVRIEELEAQNAAQQQRIDDLEARLAALETASPRSSGILGLLPGGVILLAGLWAVRRGDVIKRAMWFLD